MLLLLRLGLPLTAFVVAFNPIWGFTWYLNTESWVTGIYQKLTELRVDPWRIGMIDAVTRAYGGGDELFQINPDGVTGSGDFSFLVIGDPGEGDASQYALISRYLELGHRDDVKFLVVASDVIYPAGEKFFFFKKKKKKNTTGLMHWRRSMRISWSPRRRVLPWKVA